MTRSALLPPATLGLLGGGQLGRFFVLAASELGYRVVVLDPDPHSPAGRIAHRHLCAAYDDVAALDALARECAAVTTEFENVPATTLEHLAQHMPVHPGAAAVAVCQDRIVEKTFLRERGLPHGPFHPVRHAGDLDDADAALFPAILKVARLGYDGKGQVRVTSLTEARAAFEALGHRHCILEALLPLDCEISVVLARGEDGSTVVYPPAENRHSNGILDVSIVPARVVPEIAAEARRCAERIADELAYVGTLAVEFFVSGGRLLVNELAPRPHNSGHWTIDAAVTSQYEQQVRALCGLPLGDTTALASAVMVNLLGDLWPAGGEPDWSRLLSVADLKLHLYGKHEARPGRKMGHFTVVATESGKALETALRGRREIGIGS